MVRERAYRGTGGLEDWFPATVAAWRDLHPEDEHLAELLEAFCASAACAGWRESAGVADGHSLEEAFQRFFEAHQVGDPAVREEELFGALLRALAVTPRASFARPSAIRAAPGGYFAVTRRSILHMAVDGRYARGPVPTLVVAVLDGDTNDPSAPIATSHGASPIEVHTVREELRAMRLIA